MTVIYSGVTHKGNVRAVNEDAIGWSEPDGLAFVADGVGGHVGGQLASTLTKRVLLDTADQRDVEMALAAAHTAIVNEGKIKPELQGMGTTIVLLSQRENKAKIWWVGDSRAYLWRNKKLEQLTVDHSYVEILREKFKLNDEQIKHHPQRHLVTQTLGLDEPEPECLELDLKGNDCFLLCSDGLSDDVSLEQLQQIFREHSADMHRVNGYLLEAALAAGGRDNISAVLVKIDGKKSPNTDNEKSPVISWLYIALVVAVLGVAFLTFT